MTGLRIDIDYSSLVIRKRLFFRIAHDATEYEKSVIPTEELTGKLRERGVDIFTFVERKWCHPITNPLRSWTKASENIALLHVTTYGEWWESAGKKTRNMVRKAEKNGVMTRIAQPDEKLAEGIWKIYNETPIRQGRAFPYFGTPLKNVVQEVLSLQNCTWIGAYLENELAGYALLPHGEHITLISQILSLQKYWDKAVNNALIAKAIEVCANRREEWIMYGRIGNHPTLDAFKQNNSFTQFKLARYYIPLTRKGKIATRLGIQREIKDVLPQRVKRPLFPLYNWISGTKIRIKLRMHKTPDYSSQDDA